MTSTKHGARKTRTTDISVADAKKHLSECLARVAFGGEVLLITRRGRPMARLVPVEPLDEEGSLAGIQGWLDDGDPFFDIVDDIVARRAARPPRVLATKRSTRRHGAGA